MEKIKKGIEVLNGNIFIAHETAMSIERFRAQFPGARFSQKKGSWRLLFRPQTVEKLRNLVGDFEAPEILPDVRNRYGHLFKTKAYEHQLKALSMCGQQLTFAYFMEPGLGKTKTLIDDMCILHSEGKVDTVLVVCPKSVINTWTREIDKHCFFADIRWKIVNPDKLTGKSGKGFREAESFLLSSTHNCMCIDESTMIVNQDSLRSRACEKLGRMAAYRRIMTGDPLANAPIDIYNQLYWLDPEYVNRRSYYAFRGHFCIMGGFKGKKIVGYHNRDEMNSLITAAGYRVRTMDVFDLPPQNWQVREVELKKKTRTLYDEIVENEIVPLFGSDGTIDSITAKVMLTKMVKLAQLCGGVLRTDNGVAEVGNEKLLVLEELHNEIGSAPMLVWCHYSAEIEMIYKRFSEKIRVERYQGSTNLVDRGRIEERFEESLIDMLILQDDTGHLGLTLNRAKYAVFYSNHLRPIVRNQAERRNWRIGQKNPVFYYDLLTTNLMDSSIYKLLQRKRRLNDEICDGVTREKVMETIYGNG